MLAERRPLTVGVFADQSIDEVNKVRAHVANDAPRTSHARTHTVTARPTQRAGCARPGCARCGARALPSQVCVQPNRPDATIWPAGTVTNDKRQANAQTARLRSRRTSTSSSCTAARPTPTPPPPCAPWCVCYLLAKSNSPEAKVNEQYRRRSSSSGSSSRSSRGALVASSPNANSAEARLCLRFSRRRRRHRSSSSSSSCAPHGAFATSSSNAASSLARLSGPGLTGS